MAETVSAPALSVAGDARWSDEVSDSEGEQLSVDSGSTRAPEEAPPLSRLEHLSRAPRRARKGQGSQQCQGVWNGAHCNWAQFQQLYWEEQRGSHWGW